MKKTILIGAMAVAIVVSACAESESSRSANVATAKSEPSTTTTTSPTTTTTASPTTIAAPVEEQKFEALLQSLEVSDTMVSGRMEVSMRMTGLDPQEFGVSDAEILFTSMFDSESGDNSLVVDMSSLTRAMDPPADETGLDASLLGRSEMRQVGDRVFMYTPAPVATLGGETDWISMPVEGTEQYIDNPSHLPSDPATIMDSYSGAGATLDTIGPQQANGVSTTHYRITLETDGLREQMTPSEREEAGYSPFFAEGVVPLDLWVSADGYVVRMVLEINADMVETSLGDDSESVVVEFNMFDINERIVVSPPPASDVTPIEDIDPLFEFRLEG